MKKCRAQVHGNAEDLPARVFKGDNVMDIKTNNTVVYLTPEFTHFVKCSDFLGLDITCDTSLLKESALDIDRKSHYDRVKLRRAFPFTSSENYISVLDEDLNEIGLIEDITVYPEYEIVLIREELERVYYSAHILKIKSVKEKLGYAYFAVQCDCGDIDIPLRDIYRSIIRIGEDRIVMIDVDGNRYYIDSVEALDKKSRKKLEMYI